jgi:hypothetical protein
MSNYEQMSNEDLLLLRKRLIDDASLYHNRQLVRKIQLNSAYGAVG